MFTVRHLPHSFLSVVTIAFLFLACGGSSHLPKDAAAIAVPVSQDAASQTPCPCTCVCEETCTCNCECGPTEVVTMPPQIDAPTSLPDASAKKDAALTDSGTVWCKEGSKRESYSGDKKYAGVGACHSRLEICDPSSGEYVVEREEILPTEEIPWDGIDQDCDGADLECPVYVSAVAVDAGIETGAPTSPWKTIQGANDNVWRMIETTYGKAPRCETMIVKRGTYHEQVHDVIFGIIKSEEGAGVTIIDPSGTADEPIGIKIQLCSITVEGFTIANAAGIGIQIDTFNMCGEIIIQHNILLHNNTGILVRYNGPGDGSPVIIRNNIIIGDPNTATKPYDGTGIMVSMQKLRWIENNLIIGNRGTSITSAGVFIDHSSSGFVQNNIIADGYNGINRFYSYNTMTTQYNCLSGNTHNYVPYATVGTGDIQASPMFVNLGNGDAGTTDFHLSANSPCRNAGNPDPAFNNPDGTRNDIGPYGGPFGKW